jgi:hypothetical protein
MNGTIPKKEQKCHVILVKTTLNNRDFKIGFLIVEGHDFGSTWPPAATLTSQRNKLAAVQKLRLI